eukprot:882791-Rhodomonas_salina.1
MSRFFAGALHDMPVRVSPASPLAPLLLNSARQLARSPNPRCLPTMSLCGAWIPTAFFSPRSKSISSRFPLFRAFLLPRFAKACQVCADLVLGDARAQPISDAHTRLQPCRWSRPMSSPACMSPYLSVSLEICTAFLHVAAVVSNWAEVVADAVSEMQPRHSWETVEAFVQQNSTAHSSYDSW